MIDGVVIGSIAVLVVIVTAPLVRSMRRRRQPVSLGIGSDSLAMRRLRRVAEFPDDEEEMFYEQPCEMCHVRMMWNPAIFQEHEPHRCEKCAPHEHWYTGVSADIANRVLGERFK